MSPFAWFSSAARIAGGVIFVVALAAFGWWHHHRYMLRSEHEAQLRTVKDSLTVCKDNRTTLETAIKDQNASIEAASKLHEQNVVALARVQREAALLRKQGTAAQQTIAKLQLTGDCTTDIRNLAETIK